MLSRIQKATAQGIVNIFETGTPRGDYADVTLIKGDSGHLTYGRSQTTLGSGNLTYLLEDYCKAPGAKYSDALRPYIARCAARDLSLDNAAAFKKLLRQAGVEAVMQGVQDRFFDRIYWNPAAQIAANAGIVTPLGVAVVYDSTVHGSYNLVAGRTNRKVGIASVVGEKVWIPAYVATRQEWLANHSNVVLHTTVYRMKAFKALLEANLWDLPLPFTVRGCKLTVDTLGLAWELRLNGTPLGECFIGLDGSNYFPARALLNAICGTAVVTANLAPGPDGSLLWKGKKIPCATIPTPDGATLGKVRDLATWIGLDVDPDAASMSVNLTRPAAAKAK